MKGFTSEWLRQYQGEVAKPMVGAKSAPQPSKMRNVPTRRGAIRFDSKLEASYYDYLCALQATGVVTYFLRQPLFDLTGSVKYRADFLVFYSDGRHEVVDVKGRETEVFRIKKKQVEALYPLEIKLVRRGDFNAGVLTLAETAAEVAI